MAATTKTRAAKSKKRAGAKRQVSTKPKAINPAAKRKAAQKGSADAHPFDKRLKLSDALREEGIGVRKIAQGYASLHGTLSSSEDKGDLKLFFDVLKENHRTLEPPLPPDRGIAGDASVTIILRHNMARPARETKAGASGPDRLSTRHASEGCSLAENT